MFDNMSIIPPHGFRRIYGRIPSRVLSVSEAREIAISAISAGKLSLSEMAGDTKTCIQCGVSRFSTRKSGICAICVPEVLTLGKKAKALEPRKCVMCGDVFEPRCSTNKFCHNGCAADGKRKHENQRYRKQLTVTA